TGTKPRTLQTTTDTKTRPLTNHEKRDCTPQPDPSTEVGEWEAIEGNCEAQTVVEQRKTVETTYKWNYRSAKWVAETEESFEERTRDMTDGELAACPAPIDDPDPDPEIIEGEWEVVDQVC